MAKSFRPPAVGADEIRAILADPGRLALVAQPIVDVRRGLIVGYETLSRFSLQLPAPPDAVFRAAEAAGLGAELEALVVGAALDLATSKPANCFVTINIDPLHVLSAPVQALLATADLRGIVFEMTEHRELEDTDELVTALAVLRERGAYIAVDDAGAGYSGLKQILSLRPQFLKLDRALVSGLHQDEAKRAMIQLLGELAGRLDAWLIAEGIELEQELRALAELGVPLAQGYLLARPALPWTRLTDAVERVVSELPERALDSVTVANLVEPCATCDAATGWPLEAVTCVRLDSSGRPVGLRMLGEGGARVRTDHELMRVKRASVLSAVALRIATRTEKLRFDPVICVDDAGTFEGLIPLHKIVWALANRERDVVPISTRYQNSLADTRH